MIYADKHGQPLELEAWALLHEDDQYCTIDRTEVGEVLVSTVWIGMPAFGQMFETMVFWITTHLNGDLPVERYDTLSQAQAGHDQMVARMREQAGER